MIYAVQVPPDQQRSPLWGNRFGGMASKLPEGCWNDVVASGNKESMSLEDIAWKTLYRNADRLGDAATIELNNHPGCQFPDFFGYENFGDYLRDSMWALWQDWTEDMIASRLDPDTWQKIFNDFIYSQGADDPRSYRNAPELMVKLYSLLMDREYMVFESTGKTGSEWQRFYYPADWSNEQIYAFAKCYWNKGSEWRIYNTGDTQIPDDVESGLLKDGFVDINAIVMESDLVDVYYAVSQDSYSIICEIANDHLKMSTEEVVLYTFSHYNAIRFPVYHRYEH